PAPAHSARRSGSVSGTRFAVAGSLLPDRFPPSPPPPVARLCSKTSQVLQVCPTSQVRSSSACVLRLPDASQGNCCLGRTWDLPVPARGASVRARGLRPRGTPVHLAISVHQMGPSASPYSVGVPE